MAIISDLRATIAAAQKEIVEIQAACPHPNRVVKVTSVGNRGTENEFDHCVCGLCEAVFTRSKEKREQK